MLEISNSNGLVALITDFGTEDHYVGSIKGVILSVNRNADVIDISHDIGPQDILSAGFLLAACYRDFPKGTVFLTVVDPEVGSERKGILLATEEYYFVGPDNGLLTFVLASEPAGCVFELTNREFFREPVSSTFHGRDVFAPVAAHLSSGVPPARFGIQITDYVNVGIESIFGLGDKKFEARVIHIDRFGNLITNIKGKDLPSNAGLLIRGQMVSEQREYYSQEGTDELFFLAGSTGFLEIAAYRRSVEEMLGANVGDEVVMHIPKQPFNQ